MNLIIQNYKATRAVAKKMHALTETKSITENPELSWVEN